MPRFVATGIKLSRWFDRLTRMLVLFSRCSGAEWCCGRNDLAQFRGRTDELRVGGHVFSRADENEGHTMDPIDMQLGQAGQLRETTAEQQHALQTLVATRTPQARRPRRRPILLPALGIGGALALMGAGVAVATQWGPWAYVPDADIVIAREWTDVDGVSLGACESHLAVDKLDPEAVDAARQYLAGVDVNALDPNAESVAAALVAVDLPERMPQLIPGGDVNDYDVKNVGVGEGAIWDRVWHSDAHILQAGLVRTILYGMAEALPEGVASVGSAIETQCTTDPTDAGQ